MAIISENNRRIRYGFSHWQYTVINIVITSVVLVFLNLYTSGTNQEIIYQSKQSALFTQCQLISSEIVDFEVLNPANAAQAVAEIGPTEFDRLIITDGSGVIVYDSREDGAKYALLPEIVTALEGNRVFNSEYRSGVMRSRASMPVVSHGRTVGAVYILESDAEQGQLIQRLQNNIFTVTIVLETAIVLYSVVFSTAYSARLRKIMTSIRIIREGNYAHKVNMGGRDELTVLGKEFNDLTDRLQTSEGKRQQFVSDASHELKTPLASIKLLSDSILQNDMDMATVREFVEDIGNEADRLNRMSQKLLTLTRIESQVDGTCEIMKLAPTVKRAARMLSGIARENGIEIKTDLSGDCPILMLEDDLYQIVFNLMENGIKYNRPGGTLTVTVCRAEDNAVLCVTDTGMGIPREAIGHLFERFYRVDKARSRKSGGSGLGLAIVRNLVERNQGTISVESTPGRGSTFRVSFPIFDTGEEANEE